MGIIILYRTKMYTAGFLSPKRYGVINGWSLVTPQMKHTEVIVTSCRKNAKKEKIRRNFIAARKFAREKTRKCTFISEVEQLANYVSPFKYSPEEAAAAASKLVMKSI